jgi:hypothetical protein
MAKTTVGELVYKVTGDVSNLQTAVKNSEAEVGRLKQKLEDTDKAVKKTTESAGGLRSAIGAIAGVISAGAILGFLKGTVDAFNEQQIANSKLANSLSNVKGAREEDYQALLKQADALQKVTVFSDENIINSQALLATFQLTGSAIQSLTPRVLDMAQAVANLSGDQVDLQGATLAVGKAMTNGIGVLGRYGVAFTPAQEKAFELGDETEKLNILTQVLDDNFKGTAETIGKTFAGRVAIAKNQLGELKEQIGAALIPSLEVLLGEVVGLTGGVQNNSAKFQQLGKVLFQITNGIILFAKAIGFVITFVTFFADSAVDLGRVVVSMGKDVVNVFGTIGQRIGDVLKGIKKAFKGDFEGAAEDLKKSVSNIFNSTTQTMSENADRTKGWIAEMGGQIDSFGATLNKLQNGYKEVTTDAVKGYKAMGGAATSFAKESKDSAKATADDLNNLKDKFKDLSQKGKDALIELENSTTEKLKSIGDKIKDLKDKLAELTNDFAKGSKENSQSIADRIVAEQNALKEIQSQIAKEQSGGNADPTRIAELQAELQKRQTALQASADLQKNLQTEIIEANRRASLTDFQRDIEDLQKKQLLAQQEFEAKKKQIEDDIKLQEDEKKRTVELYTAKHAEIELIIKTANEKFQAFSNERVAITRKEVNAQIQIYNDLASAIARAKAAQTTQLLQSGNKPQFAVGGFVDARGGDVHPGEYVVPANLVQKFGGVIASLEAARTGSSINNTKTVNAPININAQVEGSADWAGIAREMAWELNRR